LGILKKIAFLYGRTVATGEVKSIPKHLQVVTHSQRQAEQKGISADSCLVVKRLHGAITACHHICLF